MKRISVVFIAVFFLVLILTIFIQERLFGLEYKYESKDRRDPFIPLIISQRRISLGLEAVETIDDIRFEGVIFDPAGSSVAVVNGEIVREGEKIHNVEIVKIYDNAIKLKIYDKAHTIGLIEEGGGTFER